MLEILRLPRLRWRKLTRTKPALAGIVGMLGYGVDGRGVVEYVKGQEAVKVVRIFDDNVTRYPLPDGNVERGETLDGVDLLFRSPGFPLTHPLVLGAKKRGIPITSSTSYFLQHFPGTTVGVTGSNGKTTCSTLIAEMLRAEFGEERVEEGGNDRTPRLDLLSQNPKSEIRNPKSAVLELSSFQLIDCPVSPDVAVVLNITPNHLDWHADMDEYAEAKRQIVASQTKGDIAILNQRDHIVETFANGLKSDIRWFEDSPNCKVLCRTHVDTIRAAVTASRALGVAEEHIRKALREFRGVPHRLEFIREIAGATWYNDSSCTTPESAITACEAFPEGSVILLLGGRDKGMDFSRLYGVIEKRKVRVILYGETAKMFKEKIPKNLQLSTLNSPLSQVLEIAAKNAHLGDNVVFSPACTSFDMFENAKERGRRFEEVVQGL